MILVELFDEEGTEQKNFDLIVTIEAAH